MLKEASRDELMAAIRNVHAGETSISNKLISKLAKSVSSEALTARELQVLALAAQGASNRDIASDLEVRETTVKSHLRSIFSKLDAYSRTEAIAIASRKGLIKA